MVFASDSNVTVDVISKYSSAFEYYQFLKKCPLPRVNVNNVKKTL